MDVFGEAVGEATTGLEIRCEHDELTVRLHAEYRPRIERWVPQQLGHLVLSLLEESLREWEVILGSEANNLDDVFVLSSELLDLRRFCLAGRSMRGPEPQQHRFVAVDDIIERRNPAIGNAEHFDIEHGRAS